MGDHPLGLEPSGNLLMKGLKQGNLRDSESLGVLRSLPDDILLHIFSALGPEERGRAACCSKAFYLLCNLDDLWKAHVLEDIPHHFDYQPGGWRATWLRHMRPSLAPALRVPSRKVHGFYSDLFHQPWHCATGPMLPEWLENETIERVENISFDEFRERFEIPNRPVIVRGVVDKWPAFKKWKRAYLEKHFGDCDVIAGGHKLRFSEYMRYCTHQRDEMPLYLFDKHFVQNAPQLGRDYSVPDIFREDLFSVLGDRRPDYRWMILGPQRSGSSFHVDPNATSAWNAVIYGAKRWILLPPRVIPPGVVSSVDGASVATSVSLYEWFENHHGALEDLEGAALEGTCGAGEMIYVPRGWWHMAINLDETLALTQNFVSTVNLPHVLRFLKNGTEDHISGLPMDQRAGLYNRFVEALEAKEPVALAGAREVEAQRQKTIAESQRLASLFSEAPQGTGKGEGRPLKSATGAGVANAAEDSNGKLGLERNGPAPGGGGGFSFGFKF